jgi:pyrroline-5-carboxylate reductase
MSKILFIGAGNMGQAMISGIIKNGVFKKEDIYIYEINEETKKKAINNFGVNECKNIDLMVYDYDTVVFAIKPQVFFDFIYDEKTKNLKDFLNKNHSVISIMAGVRISSLEEFLGSDKKIFRVMPNTPALIGKGVSAIAANDKSDMAKLEGVKRIFESIGIVEVLDEKHLDAVTALSGSGPAYVFLFIESLVQAGVLCGLPKSISEKFAVQLVGGSTAMIDGSRTVEELRHMVTSPGGTTVEALSILEKNGFRGIIMDAVKQACIRSKELGGK